MTSRIRGDSNNNNNNNESSSSKETASASAAASLSAAKKTTTSGRMTSRIRGDNNINNVPLSPSKGTAAGAAKMTSRIRGDHNNINGTSLTATPRSTPIKRDRRPKIKSQWDPQTVIICILLLIPTYFFFSIQSKDQLSEKLNAILDRDTIVEDYRASKMEQLLNKLSSSQKEKELSTCHNPVRRSVPHLLSEQKYSNQLATLPVAPSKLSEYALLESKRICIIMTTYNVVDYVSIAMDSVLTQTYQNLEIIVVDDNSNDGTTDLLLKKYATNPPNASTVVPTVQIIHLTHNTNGGAGQPSNIGMESCSNYTDYVMFADGDDYIENDAVESMLAHAFRFKTDVVMADFDVVETLDDGSMSSTPSYDFQHWDELPSDIPFNVITHPRLLRTSPVPWRKLYKRKMLLQYNVKFPEGDYFYEDNGFHWLILTVAARCSKIDRVLFHHRRARKGQTSYNFHHSSSSERMSIEWVQQYTNMAKLGGYFPNAHNVGLKLFPETLESNHDSLKCLPSVAPMYVAKTFVQWLKASQWIGKKQLSRQMSDKFLRRLDQLSNHWALQKDVLVPNDYWTSLNESTVNVEQHVLRKGIDLSIVMPTMNVGDMIYDLLKDMYSKLTIPDFTFEVFAIDDGSSDGTADILRDFADDHKGNFYFLSTMKSNGAGKARNVAIPLIEGRYVYFVDADDAYDFSALVEAVNYATREKHDILVFPYNIEYIGPNKDDIKKMEMMKADARIWDELRKVPESEKNQNLLKKSALALINYPWKQLTSSKVMKDADVFFGPTQVHNDVQFHWLSIATSHNLHFYDKVVCAHRKYDSAVRGQLTEVKDNKRMSVFPSLGMTQRALARNGAFNNDFVFNEWRKFCKNLFGWAKSRIPKESTDLYKKRTNHFLSMMESNTTDPRKDLVTWPYWGERFVPIQK